MCSSQQPWAVTDDLSYGFAAVNIAGGSESSWCCACYELTFTSGTAAGKKMIVQATNTGGDLAGNQFDISVRPLPLPLYQLQTPNPNLLYLLIDVNTNNTQMPGGGVGIFNGCTAQWGAPSSGWGAQYGGISAASSCSTFPTALQPGCKWRFDWFANADNPNVSFKQVECPAAITAKSGCTRTDDSAQEAPDAVSGTPAASMSAAVIMSSTKAAVVAEPELTSIAIVVADPEPSSSSSSLVASPETTAAAAPVSEPTTSPSTTPTKPSTKLTVAPGNPSSSTSSAAAPTSTDNDDDEDEECEREL